MIRLALVCTFTALLARPSAPINKQASVSTQPNKTVKKVQIQKPQLEKVAVKEEVVIPTPTPQPERPVLVATPVQEPPTDRTELMRLAGIPAEDYSHVDYIVSKESSWNYQAVNSSSGATGLCQAWPAEKMATEGSDYLTNPITQLKWCHKYSTQRYGSWYSAFAFWQANRWW